MIYFLDVYQTIVRQYLDNNVRILVSRGRPVR